MPEINRNINKTHKLVLRTESQNICGCRSLSWSSDPILARPPRKNKLSWVAFEYLQGGRLQKLGSVTLSAAVSPDVEASSVCAHCLWSCHWVPLKTLDPLLCMLPSGFCTYWWDPLWAFSSPGYTALPALSLSSLERCSSCLIIRQQMWWEQIIKERRMMPMDLSWTKMISLRFFTI